MIVQALATIVQYWPKLYILLILTPFPIQPLLLNYPVEILRTSCGHLIVKIYKLSTGLIQHKWVDWGWNQSQKYI